MITVDNPVCRNYRPLQLLAAAAGIALLVSTTLPAWGQTARTIGGVQTPVSRPMVQSPQSQVTTQPMPPLHPGVPVPESMVQQARQQAEGQFTTMQRGSVGGQVQDAWDRSKAGDSIHKEPLNEDGDYKVRLREYMVTLIELPRGEKIAAFDIGDPENYDVKQRGDARLAVKPYGYGIDTNLLIYGQSGIVYPLYLRTESLNSRNIPDTRYVIEGTVRIEKPAGLADHDGSDIQAGGERSGSGHVSAPGDGRGMEGSVSTSSLPSSSPTGNGLQAPSMAAMADASKAVDGKKAKPDFVADVPFDPAKLRGWGDYRLWGSGDDLKPETVFRDDQFTYIRFGDKWKDIELPTAYVVVDGIDELVNTRVQGTTLIVESTQRLISLKSGKSYLCVEYRGRG